MELPISVITTPGETNRLWFDTKCLPQIRSNNPAEVIVQEDGLDLQDKRNKGAVLATQPYIIFLEGGIYLYEFALKDFLAPLLADSEAVFSFSDVSLREDLFRPSMRVTWDPKVIGTMAVVRRETLLRTNALKPWDALLAILAEEPKSAYIKSVLFEKHAA